MHDFYWLNVHIAKKQRRVFFDVDKFESRRTGYRLTKHIFKTAAHLLGHPRQGIHRHRAPRAKIERAHIVQPNHMVVVLVGEQHGIHMAHPGT